jgi:protein-S-isoprenylcysteine O-methyltransferase Ste14
MAPRPPAWWRGTRGEWYVVAQIGLIALVFFGPRNPSGTALPVPRLLTLVGVAMMVIGVCGLAFSALALGANLTPLPRPKADATRVEAGPYRFVRHPMYAAGIALALGWALWVRGWLTLVYAAALFALFDVKSRREERWLVEKFPGYLEYRRRVRRFFPYLY